MKLLVIDGNSIINRAFYGIRLLTNRNGVHTNAVQGFMTTLLRITDEVKPDGTAAAFDLKAPTFRHKTAAYYKANRKGMPPELAEQMPIVKKLLHLMGIKVIECEGYEADDILGTLSKQCSDSGDECYLLTGDRDSLQLIDGNVTVLLATNKETIHYTPERFREDYGFEPQQLIDLKALMGDSSDNYPGAPGIGEKTAAALIKQFGSVDRLYQEYKDSDLKAGVKNKLETGEKSVRESRFLAEIIRNAPIGIDKDGCTPGEMDRDGLSRLLTELEMSRLLKSLGLDAAAAPAAEVHERIEPVFSPLTREIISGLAGCSYVLEDGRLFVRDGNNVYTARETEGGEELIADFLSSECSKITTEAKPHYRYALSHGRELKGIRNDVAVAGYLLSSGSSDYSVRNLCAQYGAHYYSEGIKPETDDKKKKKDDPRSDDLLIADLLSLNSLSEQLLAELDREGMRELLENVELPLTEVLADMEDAGVLIDTKGVEEFGERLSGMIDTAQQEVWDEAGQEFNIASTRTLGKVLFEDMGLKHGKKTKSGYSTDAETLEGLKDESPIIGSILRYRQYAKLRSTYVTGLLSKVDTDGRIHTCFRQTETRTGRISSTEPNLQNIPVRTELGAEMRRFFISDTGKVLIDADYSQIELRVMAHMCGDENMINAFTSGEDIHTSTAASVFRVPADEVTPELRSAAKAVNFGIIYGIGAFSLSKDIGTSVYQASQYISDYLARFPKVGEFMDNAVKQAEETGSVTTMFGRKRRIPELSSSNGAVKAAGKRIAMNTPVQGTAADLIKMAMINVYRRLRQEQLPARLILQIHDELIIEADISCADRCEELLREEMMNVYDMKVPLSVDVSQGRSWYEAK